MSLIRHRSLPKKEAWRAKTAQNTTLERKVLLFYPPPGRLRFLGPRQLIRIVAPALDAFIFGKWHPTSRVVPNRHSCKSTFFKFPLQEVISGIHLAIVKVSLYGYSRTFVKESGILS
jgi:hypothetical protein